MRFICTLLLIISTTSFAGVPDGDTIGKVSAVYIANDLAGYNSFLVYFSSTTKDRWSCIENNGYIRVRDNGVGVSAESYKQMFTTALTAQTTGKFLTLNSSGTDPCINVNGAFMHD